MSVIGRFRMMVLTGQTRPSPSMGQTLGPLGINMMQFTKEFNERTSTVRHGIPIQVTLISKTDKTYDFWLRTPETQWFVRRVARAACGGNSGIKKIVGNVTKRELYHIAKVKSMDPSLIGIPIRNIFRYMMGTSRAMGIMVSDKLTTEFKLRDDTAVSSLEAIRKERRANNKAGRRG